jgi:hypothetical protein
VHLGAAQLGIRRDLPRRGTDRRDLPRRGMDRRGARERGHAVAAHPDDMTGQARQTRAARRARPMQDRDRRDPRRRQPREVEMQTPSIGLHLNLALHQICADAFDQMDQGQILAQGDLLDRQDRQDRQDRGQRRGDERARLDAAVIDSDRRARAPHARSRG